MCLYGYAYGIFLVMRIIKLNKGKVTLVDDADFEWLNKWKWHATYKGYAVRYRLRKDTGKPRGLRMHRVIMECPANKQIDHINGDRLDNRRANLRIVVAYQNSLNRGLHKNNTSGYKGVSWYPRDKKWYVQLNYRRKHYSLGLFKNIKDAITAYNKKSKLLLGEFHREII